MKIRLYYFVWRLPFWVALPAVMFQRTDRYNAFSYTRFYVEMQGEKSEIT